MVDINIVQSAVVLANIAFTAILGYLKFAEGKVQKQIISADSQQKQINDLELDVAVLQERSVNDKAMLEKVDKKLDEVITMLIEDK